MNKKGIEVSLILIPLVALFFCIMVIFAFITFKNDLSNRSENFNALVSEVLFAEERTFYLSEFIIKESIDCSSEKYGGVCEKEIKERIIAISVTEDFEYYAMGNFFGLLRTGQFEFEKINEGYVLRIDNLFVQSSFGKTEKNAGSKIKRNFDLEMKFNEKGEIVSKKASFTQDL